MMREQAEHDLAKRDTLQLAARALAGLELEELPEHDARLLARRALQAAETQQSESHWLRPHAWLPCCLALATLVALAVWRVGPSERHAALVAPSATTLASEPRSQRFLSTGDRLVAVAGARYRVRSTERARRRVELQSGAMLFDVAKLGRGQHFQVGAPAVELSVLGTVFTVETHDGVTVVRVYEGRVSLLSGGRELKLGAGERFASDASLADAGDVLHDEAQAAAARRARAPVQTQASDAGVASADGGGTAVDALERPTQLSADAGVAAPAPSLPALPACEPNLAAAQESLMRHEYQVALACSERALALQMEPVGEWQLVRADALAALGETRAAVDALEAAIPRLPGVLAVEVAYRAAMIHADTFDDPARALYVLQATLLHAPQALRSPRYTELRIRLLLRLGREWEARAVARRQVREQPNEPRSAIVEAALAGAGTGDDEP
ncbi:MAG TPA: FecR family protein [Polyangiales bacterium]|nr:FecR family protein [Polyangiales bacterium]